MTPRLMHTSGDDSTSLSSSADIVELGGLDDIDVNESEAIYEEIPDQAAALNTKVRSI